MALLAATACSEDTSTSSGNSGTGGSAGASATGAGAAGGAGASGGLGGAGGSGGGGNGSPQLPAPDLGDWTGETPPVMVPSAKPPGDLSMADATHYGALSCGPFAENLFDILIPKAAGPLPLLVYIHGGGFTGGSRTKSFSGNAAQHALDYLAAGLGYATIDYRFRDAIGEGVRTSLQDSQVCLQFIRYHAKTLGIDPQRIVLAGGSAGAGTSLWLATSDEMAKPESGHAILAMSTRVRGVILDSTQATYDLLDWPSAVFAPEYDELVQASLDGGDSDKDLKSFYGLGSISSSVVEHLMTDAAAQDYRAAVDMLELMTPDDVPIWAQTNGADEEPTTIAILNHHPFHVRAIMAAAQAATVEVVANVKALGASAAEDRTSFALRVSK